MSEIGYSGRPSRWFHWCTLVKSVRMECVTTKRGIDGKVINLSRIEQINVRKSDSKLPVLFPMLRGLKILSSTIRK